MEQDFRAHESEIAAEVEKQSALRKKSKKIAKTLENEQTAMNEELRSQGEYKERIIEECRELEDAIVQINENMDDLNEQMLRIDLKIS